MVVILQTRKQAERGGNSESVLLTQAVERYSLSRAAESCSSWLNHMGQNPLSFCLRTQDIPGVTASKLLCQEEGTGAVSGWGLQLPADCHPLPLLHSLSNNGLSVDRVHCMLSAVNTCQNLAELHIR